MGECYVIEVSLRGVQPRIWRKFMISTDASFAELHEAIQDCCGWENRHLSQFRDAKQEVLAELPDDESDELGPDAMVTPIRKALGRKKGKKILYVYDFGDNWEHDVEVMALDRDWPDEFGRQLLAGERAFPPENCGGLQGYEDCCEVATGKRKDRDRLHYLEGWEPEKFDVKETARLYYQTKLFLRASYEEQL